MLLSSVAPLLAQEAAPTWRELEGVRPAQWRVIWHEDPAHEATVSWSTEAEGNDHRVLASESAMNGIIEDYPQSFTARRNGKYSLDPSEIGKLEGAWYHHATLDNLKPSTTYYFVILSNGEASPEMHFVTAPEDARPFKLLYGGDSRSGHIARQVMYRLMASLALEDPSILAFAHGGDFIYSGRLWGDWGQWLSHHELGVLDNGRVLPIIPVRGNHDSGPLFNEIFDTPGGDNNNYYVTEIGTELALITLNSETSTTGDQAVWLEEALSYLRPTHTWLVAQFHRPLYPAVKTPGPAKSTWVPLFEHYDLDLVLESDGHVLKRTMPIRSEKFDPTGVTYIGEGGLGVPQRNPDSERWYLKAPGMTASAHHITLLEFSPDKLHMVSQGPPLAIDAFMPEGFSSVIEAQSSWSYLAGEDPTGNWTDPSFDASSWNTGQAGFGFGDDDDTTVLDGMRGSYQRVYLRKSVQAADLKGYKDLALMIRYDDAFIAYINGTEFCRSKVGGGAGAQATDVESHEARTCFAYFPIPNWRDLIEGDAIVIAIEGHNAKVSSSDFTLDPFLIADPTNLSSMAGENGRIILDDHTLLPREDIEKER
ncbi:MAG: hypothetical protein ACI8X5_000540 [Planctomycetota bacterium]